MNCTSRIEARMVSVRSLTTVKSGAGRNGALQARQLGADARHRLDDVGAGLALDVDDDGRLAADTSRRRVSFSSPSTTSATSHSSTGASLR